MTTRLSFHKLLLLLMVAALLGGQWTSAHIHLGEHHDHGSGHHQHEKQAHSHGLASHHADAIDVAHGGDDRVVELEGECSSTNHPKKTGGHAAALLYHPDLFACSIDPHHFAQAQPQPALHHYLSYSTVRLRAPPAFS